MRSLVSLQYWLLHRETYYCSSYLLRHRQPYRFPLGLTVHLNLPSSYGDSCAGVYEPVYSSGFDGELQDPVLRGRNWG